MKFAALMIAALLLAAPVRGAVLTGHAYNSDGDSVEIAGQHVRLLGIDAPESEQRCLDAAGAGWQCGHAAWQALVTAYGSDDWLCEGDKHDRYGRLLATCYVGEVDVNRWMVREGWALSFRRYRPHPYDGDEEAARVARAGLWTGAFHAPWAYRGRDCSTTEIMGAVAVPIDARERLCR